MDDNRIKVGDTVLVKYPATEKTNNPARCFDGQEFVVKRKRIITTSPSNKVYYELYGAVSKYGVPYAFLEDELIKL